MQVSRWQVIALLLVAGGAGCARGPAADGPTPGPSTPRPSSTTVSTSSTSSTSPARTAGSSRPAASASVPSETQRVPAVSRQARTAGLIDVRTIVSDAIVDLRYATSDNFVGVPLYPATARCLVHKSMAAGLTAAADRLRDNGDVLVFWDCYRPHAVQVRMFAIVPDPTWVARPGPYARSHEAARSVDITLAHAAIGSRCPPVRRVQRHCRLDMGTEFDDFSARAHAFAIDGVSPLARANRSRLRAAMDLGGITGYPGEWWHFDGPGAGIGRPHLHAPLH